jgi:(2Fe-2S) ferredoxin
MYYKKHLLFCTNQKISGKKCCQQGDADAMMSYAKCRLQELELHGRGNYRVSRAGCLGRCSQGPNLLIYPEGVWYSYTSKADIEEIIQHHVLKGEIVERLLVNKP